ncbi:MAG: hypothetical protein U0835_18525 [Isosphaeraceae bacterium]
MLHEEVPIVPAGVAAMALTYFGFEVERRRHRLRTVFNVFDKQESRIAEALEKMVESGQLVPYSPPAG